LPIAIVALLLPSILLLIVVGIIALRPILLALCSLLLALIRFWPLSGIVGLRALLLWRSLRTLLLRSS
jgi:hypothetical protein